MILTLYGNITFRTVTFEIISKYSTIFGEISMLRVVDNALETINYVYYETKTCNW